MSENRQYQIPRKVNEGITIFGLGTREMVLMILPVALAVILLFFSGWETTPRIVISFVLAAGSYFLITVELGNGLKALEYVKLLINYHLLDQNEYHLLSGKTVEREINLIRYEKSDRVTRPVLVSEIPDKDDEVTPEEKEQKRKDLEELAPWIPEPKIIRMRKD